MITNIDWTTTQRIEVTNEDGSKSILETGLTTLYKPEYFQEHLDYLHLCNPTKTFTLINSNIMTKLTQQQLTKVKEQFCLNMVDDMDLNTLKDIVSDQLIQSYDDWDEVEFKDEVISYYNEETIEYNKIVNTVTNSPYSSYGDYVTTNPETNTDYGVGK